MRAQDTEHRRVKVAVLIGTLEVGGAELDIVRNFPRLNRDDFEVVCVTFGPPGTLAPELERQGIPVIARVHPKRRDEQTVVRTRNQTPYERFVLSLPVSLRRAVQPAKRAVGRIIRWITDPRPIRWVTRRFGSAVYVFGVTRWVRRTLREQHVDIVHSFLPHSYAYGMVAGWFMRPHPRQVMSRLSLNFYSESHPTLAWLERAVLHSSVDVAVGNSRQILDELAEEGVPSGRLRLLHNGIDPEPFRRAENSRARARLALGVAPDAFTIVAVGNLHTYKGHRDLIEACAGIADRLPDGWRLLIGGRDESGNRAAYESLIEARGLSEHVSLLGPVDDVPQLLLAGDVFVQPSHHEGLPNAVIEAMAASLPVIGTAVGGIPEAVLAESAGAARDAATGWLVAPHDAAAIASALLESVSDPERSQAMGERARQRVLAEFSLATSVSSYEAIYRGLVPRSDASTIMS